jgi:hypothetical protein
MGVMDRIAQRGADPARDGSRADRQNSSQELPLKQEAKGSSRKAGDTGAMQRLLWVKPEQSVY